MKHLTSFILIISALSGCASSSEIEKHARQHDKNAEYYKSIGQPGTEREERDLADKDRESSQDIFAIFTELFTLFSKDENKN